MSWRVWGSDTTALSILHVMLFLLETEMGRKGTRQDRKWHLETKDADSRFRKWGRKILSISDSCIESAFLVHCDTFFFLRQNFLCSSNWFWTHNSPTSVSLVLRLLMCTTITHIKSLSFSLSLPPLSMCSYVIFWNNFIYTISFDYQQPGEAKSLIRLGNYFSLRKWAGQAAGQRLRMLKIQHGRVNTACPAPRCVLRAMVVGLVYMSSQK